MDIDCLFSSLLYLSDNDIINCLTMCKFTKSLNTEYLWKILYDDRCSKFYNKECVLNWYNTYKIYMSVATGIDKILVNIFDNVDDVNEFKNTMTQMNAVISGSFIIQKILGETYKDSDIDIYLPVKQEHKMDDFFDYKIERVGYLNVNAYKSFNRSLMEIVKDYEKNGYKIQLIYINSDNNIDSVCEFVKNDFDFDICKNMCYYNKENCGKCTLIVHDINQILKKQTEFKTSAKVGKSIDRCYKYQKRGFIFTNLENLSYDNFNFHLQKDENDQFYKIIEITQCNETMNRKCTYMTNDLKKIKSPNDLDNDYPIKKYSNNQFTFKYESDECNKNCHIKFCNSMTEHYHYSWHNIHYIFVVVN